MNIEQCRRLVATLLTSTVATFTLGACGTGVDAQTNKQYQAGVGADHRSGAIKVLATLFVANHDGSATLSASIVNDVGVDITLTDVDIANLDGKPLLVKRTPFLMPVPNGMLRRIGIASDAGGYVVTSGARAGDYLRVTMHFTPGAPVTLIAPVVSRTARYESVSTGITEAR